VAHQFHLLLSDHQYRALDEEANRSGISIAEQIRRFIDTMLGPHNERKVVVIEHTLGRRPGRRIG
jgi:hypothetical protein